MLKIGKRERCPTQSIKEEKSIDDRAIFAQQYKKEEMRTSKLKINGYLIRVRLKVCYRNHFKYSKGRFTNRTLI